MSFRSCLFLGAAGWLFVIAGVEMVAAQTTLPSVTVTEPKKAPAPTPKKAAQAPATAKPRVVRAAPVPRRTRVAASPRRTPPTRGPVAAQAAPTAGGASSAGPAVPADVAAARAGEAQAQATRERILPRGAANATTLTQANIDALPAGNQTGFNQLLLNLPGITQDAAGSGDFHIRNEHSNAQYRINGIFVPDAVSGFSQVLDSTFVRSVTLLDGALPAQYGLRTAGVIDITTRTGADAPGTVASIYGGSRGTIQPTIVQSGTSGRWDYLFTGRYVTNQLGINNPLPTSDAIHDRTRQGRYFAYMSGVLEDSSRLTFMSGAAIAKYQIPNSPFTPPAFTAFGLSNFDSAFLNENQIERSIFNVLAWQKTIGPLDTQVSYFQRYSSLHFTPDQIGDVIFNGVASDVTRTSLVNGVQTDNAWRTSSRNTVRFGFIGQVERSQAIDSNVVLPLDAMSDSIDAPFAVGNANRLTGYTLGGYVQDEYFLTPRLSVTGGLRYDYMRQVVSADQLSPRLGGVWRPTDTTTFHAGYARYFTPPLQALAAQSPQGLYANTTLAPEINQSSPVRPERSHYFDAGVTQRVLPGLDVGVDVYHKIARNLLDSGQFGSALILTNFNYDRAYNQGMEFKANYEKGNFRAFGNLALARQRGTIVSSGQYLFEAEELAYIRNNYIPTDHDQLITVSGGASYRIFDTTLSTTVLYGSGLRAGFANLDTVSPYTTVNVGIAHDFHLMPNGRPTTLRFNVVNLMDRAYVLRDGSGIGVFQAQYGERRGFFAGLTQQF